MQFLSAGYSLKLSVISHSRFIWYSFNDVFYRLSHSSWDTNWTVHSSWSVLSLLTFTRLIYISSLHSRHTAHSTWVSSPRTRSQRRHDVNWSQQLLKMTAWKQINTFSQAKLAPSPAGEPIIFVYASGNTVHVSSRKLYRFKPEISAPFKNCFDSPVLF